MSFSESKMVVTRKEHRCEGCLENIPKGSKVEYNKGVFEGDFYSYYMCDDCREFIDNNDDVRNDLIEYGFSAGDIREYKKESVR